MPIQMHQRHVDIAVNHDAGTASVTERFEPIPLDIVAVGKDGSETPLGTIISWTYEYDDISPLPDRAPLPGDDDLRR